MIKSIFTVALFSFVICLAYASETINGAKRDLDKFKNEMTVKLNSAQAELHQLRDKAKAKSDQTMNQTVSEFEKKHHDLTSELDQLKADAEANWKKAKEHISTSVDGLNVKIQKSLKD